MFLSTTENTLTYSPNYSPNLKQNGYFDDKSMMSQKKTQISSSDFKPTPSYLNKNYISTNSSDINQFDYNIDAQTFSNSANKQRAFSQNIKAKWENPVKDQEAQRGVHNFKEEVTEIRNFLDLLHSKHESVNNQDYPPGVPSYEECLGRKDDVNQAIDMIKDRRNTYKLRSPQKPFRRNQPAPVVPQKTIMERMEQDAFARQLRDVFFEQWNNSKIMCVQGQYHKKM
ncbi:UNKNOWN [Stylonychia lemnae]|uniref:Uncharacterized protein n=1 Tax=Stylonychia lemnae TaxID=5949 RepID=A0A078A501_STYLE|nr:UNKNOWN [Stylonychia lemnae]|eukprot:CDW76934.1 UNKNOWN [Stylonychia lemnae]